MAKELGEDRLRILSVWFNSVDFVATATDRMGGTHKGLPKAAYSVASARAPLLHGRDAHATWARSSRSGCYPELNQAILSGKYSAALTATLPIPI